MKKLCIKGGTVALLALVFSGVGEFNGSASTVKTLMTNNNHQNIVQNQSNVQLAQALVGQCRAAKQRISVYPERSTTSKVITTIAPNVEVTLADNGAAGWVAISAPVTGYVQANNLKPCAGETVSRPPAPSPSKPSPSIPEGARVCRKVVYPPEGLAVRKVPELDAPRIAGVYVGDTVTLASPRQTQKDSEGRTWVLISAPTQGWISSGFPNGNLDPEFVCP
jgi:hypothetical protein